MLFVFIFDKIFTMNRFELPQLITFSFCLCLLFASCNSDKLPEPVPADCDPIVTFDNQIQPIIERNCSYTGCHDGVDANPPGNFSSYEGMEPFLNAEEFEEFVIVRKDDAVQGMPPSYAPAGRPQDLTDEELTTVQNWINCGYLEN